MPKSAKDDLIARIDNDMAELDRIEAYLDAGTSTEDVRTRISTDRIGLTKMRDYVTAQVPKAPIADKPKRTRGKGKRGLPADTTQSNGD